MYKSATQLKHNIIVAFGKQDVLNNLNNFSNGEY